MDIVGALAEAIARFEGYYRPGSRANRNNNPGNLRDRPANDRRGPIWPQYPKDRGGYVIFPSPEVGWAELRKRIERSVSAGQSLRAFLSVYAPPAENPTESYIRTVAGWLGIDPELPLRSYASGQVAQGPGAPAGQPAEPIVPPPVRPAERGSSDLVLTAAIAVAAVSALFLLFS